jgi:hypothetical protein
VTELGNPVQAGDFPSIDLLTAARAVIAARQGVSAAHGGDAVADLVLASPILSDALVMLEAAVEKESAPTLRAGLTEHDQLLLRSLLAMAAEHNEWLLRIDRAARRITGEEDMGHTSEAVYGSHSLEDLLEAIEAAKLQGHFRAAGSGWGVPETLERVE